MAEPTQATLGGPGTAGHPDLEELAALIDGRCRSADAARVRVHLASCEECYEVFLETLQLREELGEEEEDEEPALLDKGESPARSDFTRPLPYPGTARDDEKRQAGQGLHPFLRGEPLRPHYWLAAAALLIVVLGFGFYQWFRTPRFSVDGLAARTGKVEVDKLAWGERTRGIGTSTEDPSFRLGVELLNLQVALEAGDKSSADAATAAVNGLFESITFPDKGSKEYYRQLRIRMRPPKVRPEDLSAEAAKEAEVLRKSGSVGDVDFDLGTWAEAGRFAAYSRKPDFFDRGSVRHFLAKLPKEEPPPEALAALKAIDAKLAAPSLQPGDYEDLKRAFDQILRAYYPQGERGGL